ncbi:sulfotransferase domain-containing protein [Methylocella silvestris]|uniref:sulfotransferase domain-containing protein n=1 Tax=Methylocella silvestris TaxID=199596 RepID=UPI0015E0ED52|nr:sulfotransferase domain-containing protein [Methylocella silvestris]
MQGSSKKKFVPEGFTPIGEYLPEDIFVVGFPKSGNTWFQNLVAGAVFGVDINLSPPGLAHDLAPDVNHGRFYKRYATPMFFKSHDLPLPNFRRVVYLLRDGRDAMVSYRHYREVMDRRAIDLLEFVNRATPLYPCHWSEHVEAWAKNPYGADMIVIKYEDLLRDTVAELRRFCAFAGVSRDDEHLRRVAEASSFDKLREKETKQGFGRDDHAFDRPFFFRRGEAGSYKDEMSPEALRIFMDQARSTLERYGYLDEADQAASR